MARGLEAFAALAVHEDRPELAVQFAAATALRDVAAPALSGARTERYLASARHLGENTIARLWARGLACGSDQAVALALDIGPGPHSMRVTGPDQAATAPPGPPGNARWSS